MKVRSENCSVILSRGPFYTPYKSKRARERLTYQTQKALKKNFFFLWKKTTSVTDRKKIFANTVNSEGLISIGTDSKNQ